MGLFADIIGTLSTTFQLGKAGVKLKNNAAALEVKAADGTTDAPVTASKVNVSGDELDLNSDAAGSGADWKMTIKRPATGMAADVIYTLPAAPGTTGQVLGFGDESGGLVPMSAGATADLVHTNDTTIAYGDSSPVAMFTKPAGVTTHKMQVIIDTPFSGGGGAPTLSIGVAGAVSKYMATTQVDLKGAAGDIYEVNIETTAEASEDLIATLSADSATAGSVRALVFYSTPA